MRISDRDRRIISMWLDGVKSEAIAAELGCWRSAVARRVQSLGLPPRLSGYSSAATARPSLWPCIVVWARSGRSAYEIAAGIGCTKPGAVASVDGAGAATCNPVVARETIRPRRSLRISRQASKRAWQTRKRQQKARQEVGLG